GWATSAAPTSAPNPVTVMTRALGNPASANSGMNSSVEAEVNSDGLITAVLPAASAAGSFQASSSSGEFHGVIMPTTPSGSEGGKLKTLGLSGGEPPPSVLSGGPPDEGVHPG